MAGRRGVGRRGPAHRASHGPACARGVGIRATRVARERLPEAPPRGRCVPRHLDAPHAAAMLRVRERDPRRPREGPTPARAMVLTECATAHPRAARACSMAWRVEVASPSFPSSLEAAGAYQHPQEGECGDGERDASRGREHSRDASVRRVHHPAESESDARTGERAPARRERRHGGPSGLAPDGPDGAVQRDGLAFASSAVGGERTESGTFFTVIVRTNLLMTPGRGG